MIVLLRVKFDILENQQAGRDLARNVCGLVVGVDLADLRTVISISARLPV